VEARRQQSHGGLTGDYLVTATLRLLNDAERSYPRDRPTSVPGVTGSDNRATIASVS
jgi:hypothetical protein